MRLETKGVLQQPESWGLGTAFQSQLQERCFVNSLRTTSRKRKTRQVVGAKIKPSGSVNTTPRSDTEPWQWCSGKATPCRGPLQMNTELRCGAKHWLHCTHRKEQLWIKSNYDWLNSIRAKLHHEFLPNLGILQWSQLINNPTRYQGIRKMSACL